MEDEQTRMPKTSEQEALRESLQRSFEVNKNASIPPEESSSVVPGVGSTGDSSRLILETVQDPLTERLRAALRINENTNRTGETAKKSLLKQREIIQHSIVHVNNTSENLRTARSAVRSIRSAASEERVLKVGIVIGLVFLMLLLLYVKFIR